MRLTITSASSRMRPCEEQAQKLVSAGRHIITNPGSMSDIVISKCLRAHYLYEAFRAGLAEFNIPRLC